MFLLVASYEIAPTEVITLEGNWSSETRESHVTFLNKPFDLLCFSFTLCDDALLA
jgi:hypothetical protein